MKFFLLMASVVTTYFHVVQYVSAMNLTQSSEHNPIEYPDVIIETILQHLGTKEYQPVNITQINATLGYSQHALKAASDILNDHHVYLYVENVLALRSTIDVTFDAVGKIINSLESSIPNNACLVDFGLPNVRNALQVVMDVCISTNWVEGVVPVNYLQTISNETVASSVYGLSSETKTFITSASNFAQKNYASQDLVDNNLLIGVQAIVETVVNLIEIVLSGLKKMRDQERVFEHPSLIKFQFTIGKLTSHPFNLTDGITPDIFSSFTTIGNETQSNLDKLSSVTAANFAVLTKFIAEHENEIPGFIGTVEPIKSLESALRDVSNLVYLTYRHSDVAAYTLDTSSQNLIASISYLSYSIATLPSKLMLIREFHDTYEPEFQANLLYINSIIQTLNDEITLITQRQLIDIICTSSLMEKIHLKERLMELEFTIEPMILTFDKVIKSSILAVRNHMACITEISNKLEVDYHGIFTYDIDAQILFRDTKVLVSDLDGILNTDTQSTSTLSTIDNAFTVCTKAFAETAQSVIKLRDFLKKSIEQINKYLL